LGDLDDIPWGDSTGRFSHFALVVGGGGGGNYFALGAGVRVVGTP